MAEVFEGELPIVLKKEPLFFGGPVQGSALSYLHSDTFLLQANVLPNLRLGHAIEDVLELGGTFSKTQRLRFFAGYSGWGAGQLEAEMERGAWLLHPATLDLVFDNASESLWRRILHSQGGKSKLLANSPEDLSSN